MYLSLTEYESRYRNSNDSVDRHLEIGQLRRAFTNSVSDNGTLFIILRIVGLMGDIDHVHVLLFDNSEPSIRKTWSAGWISSYTKIVAE